MIMFFRKISETWIAKLLLALIALSMAGLFGLGQMTTYWGTSTDAIRIGKTAVKPQELLRDTEQKIRQVRNATGQYMSIQQALAQGILNEIIAEKINTSLSRILAQDLGLVASSNAVGQYIVNNPQFQTNTGTYDPSVLRLYLNINQMTEQQLTDSLREQLAQQQLTAAIKDLTTAPVAMQDILYSYQQETRDFETILLPSSAMKITEKPSQEDLKLYYEALTDSLYTPEYRQIQTLRLSPSDIAKSLPVSEDEIKALYEARQDIYSTPEKRRVEQILLKDEQAAQDLFAELTADNFEQLAKEKADQDKQAIDLGWVEKANVVEQIGDVTFNAPVNQVLPPVKSQFGYHILIVREIEKATQTSFDSVKDEIKTSIQAQRAYDIMQEKSQILDNALGEGKHLADAAELISVKPDETTFVDASGVNEDGKTKSNLPTELVRKIFALKPGDSTPLYADNGGYIVAELIDIKPSNLKTFEQAKDTLMAEWTKDMQHKHIAEFAQKIHTEAQKAKSLSSVAKKYDLETKDLKDVRRQDIKDILPNNVDALFTAAENDVQLITVDENNYIVVKMAKVNAADEEDEVMKRLFADALSQQMAETFYQQILAYYAQSNKVEINQQLIKETFEPYMGNAE